ncbi:hypothetical protein [Sphingomonas sp. CCH5-D11]|uniref:hypothetical protein n=1 Tax=Sphingomonas sp. CCH5-D11 TaxID=1768786 RepID=UPI0012E34F01|nr:hypothetical protein [Sphingomonas sp. CCH5-D11]
MLSIALLLQAVPAAPPAPVPPLHGGPEYRTCPVGGEQFAAWQPSMYSTYGERPDGRPYSYLPFPLPVPECPSNKLIVFDKFSEAETQKLARLITTGEYKRLVEADTTYYRAYWLATALGRPKREALGLLLSAIWQVSPGELAEEGVEKGDPRLGRYQDTFISEVRALDATVAVEDRVWLQARAANAARQMKQFGKAERLRRQAEEMLTRIDEKRGWNGYISKLRAVIKRGDASIEPLDMIPRQQVASACIRLYAPNPFDRAICGEPEISTQIANLRKILSKSREAKQ